MEIASPASRHTDRFVKYEEYETVGVPEYWLIDPDRQYAEFFQRDAAGLYRVAFSGAEGVYRSRVLYQSPSQSSELPPSCRFPPLREGNREGRTYSVPPARRGNLQELVRVQRFGTKSLKQGLFFPAQARTGSCAVLPSPPLSPSPACGRGGTRCRAHRRAPLRPSPTVWERGWG